MWENAVVYYATVKQLLNTAGTHGSKWEEKNRMFKHHVGGVFRPQLPQHQPQPNNLIILGDAGNRHQRQPYSTQVTGISE